MRSGYKASFGVEVLGSQSTGSAGFLLSWFEILFGVYSNLFELSCLLLGSASSERVKATKLRILTNWNFKFFDSRFVTKLFLQLLAIRLTAPVNFFRIAFLFLKTTTKTYLFIFKTTITFTLITIASLT